MVQSIQENTVKDVNHMPSIQMSFYRAKYKILIFFQIKDFLISRVFAVWRWMCVICGRSNIKTWAQLQIISMNVSMPAWQMRAHSYIYLHLGKKAFKLIESSPVGQIDLRKSSLYQMVLFIISWRLQSSHSPPLWQSHKFPFGLGNWLSGLMVFKNLLLENTSVSF